MLVSVEEVNDKKRFIATFSNGKTTKFGQINGNTFLDHNDKQLKSNYIKRHIRDLETNDYQRAGYLSLFLLWNKETLSKSIKDFNRRIKNNDWQIKSIFTKNDLFA
jgi:hypothetical protein